MTIKSSPEGITFFHANFETRSDLVTNQTPEPRTQSEQPSTGRTVLQIGARKAGVPSQEEMYRALKERSIQLQSTSGKK
jgi:hypothetical protein